MNQRSHQRTYPTRTVLAADFSSTALEPIRVPRGLTAESVAKQFLEHVESEFNSASAPPRLQTVVISGFLATRLKSAQASIPQVEDFFSLGLEGVSRYARFIGTFRLRVMPTVITVQIDEKEVTDIRKSGLASLSKLFINFENPKESSKLGVLLFIGAPMLTYNVLSGFVGDILSIVLGLALCFAVVMAMASSYRNRERERSEVSQLISMIVAETYGSFRVSVIECTKESLAPQVSRRIRD